MDEFQRNKFESFMIQLNSQRERDDDVWAHYVHVNIAQIGVGCTLPLCLVAFGFPVEGMCLRGGVFIFGPHLDSLVRFTTE